MVKKERIKELCKILKERGPQTRNQYLKIVEKELKLMSAQTFQNTLNAAVSQGKIIKTELKYGKLRKFEYSLPEFKEIEKFLLQTFEQGFKNYDIRFELLKSKLHKIDDEDKGVIFFHFLDWLQVIDHFVSLLNSSFQYSKFDSKTKQIQERRQSLFQLAMPTNSDQRNKIWGEIIANWASIEQEDIDEIDKMLGFEPSEESQSPI